MTPNGTDFSVQVYPWQYLCLGDVPRLLQLVLALGPAGSQLLFSPPALLHLTLQAGYSCGSILSLPGILLSQHVICQNKHA